MTQAPDVVVITSCTSRKKRARSVLTLPGTDTAQSLGALARRWEREVDAVEVDQCQAAVNLYGGRSIAEAKRTADALAAPLYIVSAGLGLLASDELIPPYDVTVAESPDNLLQQCLRRLKNSPADWWRALVKAFGEHRSVSNLITRSKDAVVLLAVPSAYLSLLAGDLAELSQQDQARLRIITSPYGATLLSAALQSTVMPYDERLEGLAAYAGTRSDFPQRALRHFAMELQGHELSLKDASRRVREAMQTLVKPGLPKRERKTDDEITALLANNWERFNGSATALLRYLRDEALVACEQSRFALLRRRLLAQLNEKVGQDG